MLIADHGIRQTESIVRGWIRNLAQPVYDREESLLVAISNGDCALGIASSDAFASFDAPDAGNDVAVIALPESYFNIVGIGIARHARNPEGAQALIEWLLENGGLSEQELADVVAYLNEIAQQR